MGRKRKAQETDSPDPIAPEVRNSANERERDRMRVLSKAFVKLKTTLPWVPPDTKLSKLDTLRLATCYIAHLRQILAEDESGGEDTAHSSPDHVSDNNNSSGFTHPINLTWPFSFQGKPSINGSSSPPPLCQESTQHEQITAS